MLNFLNVRLNQLELGLAHKDRGFMSLGGAVFRLRRRLGAAALTSLKLFQPLRLVVERREVVFPFHRILLELVALPGDLRELRFLRQHLGLPGLYVEPLRCVEEAIEPQDTAHFHSGHHVGVFVLRDAQLRVDKRQELRLDRRIVRARPEELAGVAFLRHICYLVAPLDRDGYS
jgi:hypothetical protein